MPVDRRNSFFIQINYANADFRNMANYYCYCYYSREPEQQPKPNCLSCHHLLLAFIVPVLLTALQIKYQPKETTPFETHPFTIALVIASLLVYSFLCDVNVRFSSIRRRPTCAAAVRRGTALFGSLPWVALATILLPGSITPSLLYGLCGLVSATDLLRCPFQKLWHWFTTTESDFSSTGALLPV